MTSECWVCLWDLENSTLDLKVKGQLSENDRYIVSQRRSRVNNRESQGQQTEFNVKGRGEGHTPKIDASVPGGYWRLGHRSMTRSRLGTRQGCIAGHSRGCKHAAERQNTRVAFLFHGDFRKLCHPTAV